MVGFPAGWPRRQRDRNVHDTASPLAVIMSRGGPGSGENDANKRRTDLGMIPSAKEPARDDLSRDTYCILGVPIDAIEMGAVLRSIEAAAANGAPFTISTPNLNFLVQSRTDAEFRESLLISDLCPTDGMPIVWIARLIGVPIKNRIAGSDIFEALRLRADSARALKIFLFGSTDGVAGAASSRLNSGPASLSCVGWICPGFGDVDELSQDHFIDKINASKADFLVASLGAKKGQLWLQRNLGRLRIPVRAHLGATINFQAGTVRRAPRALQKMGLEWLWRIKEEPHLWKRYWLDGLVLFRLMLTRVLPLAISAWLLRRRCGRHGHDLVIGETHESKCVTLSLRGYAIDAHMDTTIPCFRDAVAAKKDVAIDFSETWAADSRFFGLLLMLRKQLRGEKFELTLRGISPRLARLFRLHGLGYMLPLGDPHVHYV